jgi:hypothetical protein
LDVNTISRKVNEKKPLQRFRNPERKADITGEGRQQIEGIGEERSKKGTEESSRF